VAASAAALAAIASWFTASTNVRAFRRANRPLLVAQVLSVESTQLHVDVHNAGGGIALGCSCVLAAGDAKAAAFLRGGALKAGENVRIRTTITPPGHDATVEVMVGCRDATGRAWAWGPGGLRRERVGRYGRRRRDDPSVSLADVFRARHPHIDLKSLRGHSSDVLTQEQVDKLDDERLRPDVE
jgi:hypothetical protein